MKAFSKIIAIVLILSLVFAFSACSNNKEKLIGTWSRIAFKDEEWYFTFNSDGSCRYGCVGEGYVDGTYKVDGDELSVTLKGEDGTETETMTIVSISDTELVLSQKGEKTTLTKKK